MERSLHFLLFRECLYMLIDVMRIIDAGVLSYALLENHIATPFAKPIILKALRGELEVSVATTTILETYNTLYWYYHVRPRNKLLEKLELVVEALDLVEVPISMGIRVSSENNVPLGDALLVATAIKNRIPIVASNDKHVSKLAKGYGLIYENPIPESVRKEMGIKEK